MLKVSNIKVNINYTMSDVTMACAQKLGIDPSGIRHIKLLRRSVDARDKGALCFVVSVAVTVAGGDKTLLGKLPENVVSSYEEITYQVPRVISPERPVIVGFGPCGMFAALVLAQAGLRPIVLERGLTVEERTKKVNTFFDGGVLDEDCNVQFGEGGAGTFSDGKLNTGVNDPRCAYILRKMVELGADEEILVDVKPHVGTDKLVNIVSNLRKKVVELGGEIRFRQRLTDILTDGEKITAAVTQDGEIPCSALILAIGHSSRDTFEMLQCRGIEMTAKDFSIGVRIEHLQSMITCAQYGSGELSKKLPPADYKLWCHLKNGRSVYTFCMCPGGSVVAASSEKDAIVTNGMSSSGRGGKNANSALLVGVSAADFGSDNPLAGVEFQRRWERAAFRESASYRAPSSTVGDFLAGRVSKAFKSVQPTYPVGTVMSDFKRCLPSFAVESLRLALPLLDRKLKGFACPDAVITGVETRSSSPVRIIRGEDMQSIGLRGLFPSGEGAGYAGGIMSAAVDGIKCAEKIIENSKR